MVSLMILALNEKELQILTMAFEQIGVKVIQSQPNYATYIKATQYNPDVILVDFPRKNSEQIHFVTPLKKNKRTKNCFIIGYGNKMPKEEIKFISRFVDIFHERPLKFSKFINLMEKKLKASNKKFIAEKPKGPGEEDEKMLLDPITLPQEKIEIVTRHVQKLLAFPFTVGKVLQIAEDSKSGAGDLSRIISADSVISTNVMKISNTVFYATKTPITTIKDAIIRIGFVETKKIVMTISVMGSVNNKLETLGFSRTDFWHYSLGTAILAEFIAKRDKRIDKESAFLAGLLSSFGILLWDEFFPTVFEKTLEQTTDKGYSFFSAEQDLLQITEHDILKELFTSWKLPSVVINGICGYEKIRKSLEVTNDEEYLSLVIFTASIMARAYSFGKACDLYVYPLIQKIFTTLKLQTGVPKGFYDDVKSQVEMYKSFLNIKTEEISDFTIDNRNRIKIGVYLGNTTMFSPINTLLIDAEFNVEGITTLSDMDVLQKKYDIVCIVADEDISWDEAERLLTLIHPDESKVNDDGSPICTPVLAIVDKDSSLFEKSGIGNLSVMINTFDLRLFINIFERVINFEQVIHRP